MENAGNFSRKMVTIFYGFDGDVNYGVDYPTLKKNLEVYDLLPYINRAADTEVFEWEGHDILRALGMACKDLDYMGLVYENEYKVSINVRTLTEAIHITFKITKN